MYCLIMDINHFAHSICIRNYVDAKAWKDRLNLFVVAQQSLSFVNFMPLPLQTLTSKELVYVTLVYSTFVLLHGTATVKL